MAPHPRLTHGQDLRTRSGPTPKPRRSSKVEEALGSAQQSITPWWGLAEKPADRCRHPSGDRATYSTPPSFAWRGAAHFGDTPPAGSPDLPTSTEAAPEPDAPDFASTRAPSNECPYPSDSGDSSTQGLGTQTQPPQWGAGGGAAHMEGQLPEWRIPRFPCGHRCSFPSRIGLTTNSPSHTRAT